MADDLVEAVRLVAIAGLVARPVVAHLGHHRVALVVRLAVLAHTLAEAEALVAEELETKYYFFEDIAFTGNIFL